MKGMIYEFVVIASSISPCVGRKMKKLFHDIFYGLLWKFQLCHLVNICILESTFGFALVWFYTLVSTSASLYWEVVIHCCLQLRHSPRRYLVLCRPTKIFNNNRHGLVRLSTIRRIISDKRRFFYKDTARFCWRLVTRNGITHVIDCRAWCTVFDMTALHIGHVFKMHLAYYTANFLVLQFIALS